MLRVIILALLLAGIILAVILTSPPARAACQTVGCWQECRWVGPGHKRCRERCRVRCWNDAPRYYAPQPQPQYHAPAYQSHPPLDPGVLVAAGIAAVIIFAIWAAIVGASGDTTTREIEAIEQQTQSIREETAAHDNTIRGMRDYKAALLDEAEEQGRRDADEEWRRRITHG